MILIADSGSTKTAWRLLDAEGEVAQAQTVGINPYYQNTEEIAHTLKDSLPGQLNGATPQEIYFYGAGCSAADKQEVVADALRQIFPAAQVHVLHDLEAAAHALCGHEAGIACILGTGSNSCLFDGDKIVQNLPNLGFILGDEGSGGYLGKCIVQAFLNLELPQDLHDAFVAQYHTNRDEIIDNVYRKPYPNRYMAGFAKFLSDHRQHPFIYQMIYQCFADFLEKAVIKYPNYQNVDTHFVGSIAFHFEEILRTVAKQYHVQVKHILQSPIEGLSQFHQQKISV